MTEKRDIVVRYGEIGTKGKNRSEFEKKLAYNLKRALSDFDHGPIERPRGRVIIRDIESFDDALHRISLLPGVTTASIAIRCSLEMEEILKTSAGLMEEALQKRSDQGQVTFKVESVRAHKKFPKTSMELSSDLGGELIQRFNGLKAKMKNPDLVLRVEIRPQEALLSLNHIQGAGGLPVGSIGKVMVLLSGGIDSPVAAYMSMKRGARAFYINYHSYPFIPHSSLDKIKSLVKALTPFQGNSLLYVAPFSDIQVEIKKSCPEELRTLLYRRMMFRLAEMAAKDCGALALVTGECLGQVASQTLENIHCINEAATLPILRPLIGFDKVDTIRIAEKIGTYEISIKPYPDSCTVFKPRRPKIRGKLSLLHEAEERLDVKGLVETSFSEISRVRL